MYSFSLILQVIFPNKFTVFGSGKLLNTDNLSSGKVFVVTHLKSKRYYLNLSRFSMVSYSFF